MKIIERGTDLVLRLDIRDQNGKRLRVKNAYFVGVKIWTQDMKYVIDIDDRDICKSIKYDTLLIGGDSLKKLGDGQICYTYTYIRQPSFLREFGSSTDGQNLFDGDNKQTYQETVRTEYYLQDYKKITDITYDTRQY